MSDKIDNIVVPILKKIQTDISVLKENTFKLDRRLSIVESHMSGFMSHARHLDTEMQEMRGRLESLEEELPDQE